MAPLQLPASSSRFLNSPFYSSTTLSGSMSSSTSDLDLDLQLSSCHPPAVFSRSLYGQSFDDRPTSSRSVPSAGRFRKNMKDITGYGPTEEEFDALPIAVRRKVRRRERPPPSCALLFAGSSVEKCRYWHGDISTRHYRECRPNYRVGLKPLGPVWTKVSFISPPFPEWAEKGRSLPHLATLPHAMGTVLCSSIISRARCLQTTTHYPLVFLLFVLFSQD